MITTNNNDKNMKTEGQKQEIRFRIAEMIRMDAQAGKYKSGRSWSKWSQLFRGDDGCLYSCFQPRPVYASDNATVLADFAGVSPFQHKGEKVIQIKNARAVKEAEETAEEQEATDYGLNIEAARAADPFWWVAEVRECQPGVTEEDLVLGKPAYSPSQQAALAEYFGLYEPFSHPSENRQP